MNERGTTVTSQMAQRILGGRLSSPSRKASASGIASGWRGPAQVGLGNMALGEFQSVEQQHAVLAAGACHQHPLIIGNQVQRIAQRWIIDESLGCPLPPSSHQRSSE